MPGGGHSRRVATESRAGLQPGRAAEAELKARNCLGGRESLPTLLKTPIKTTNCDVSLSYTNDCVIVIDPGSLAHVPGCVAVLNDTNHKLILLVRNIPGTNINASNVGVVGAFGQITFEVTHKEHKD